MDCTSAVFVPQSDKSDNAVEMNLRDLTKSLENKSSVLEDDSDDVYVPPEERKRISKKKPAPQTASVT